MKKVFTYFVLVLTCCSRSTKGRQFRNTNLTEAKAALDIYNNRSSEVMYQDAMAQWEFYTNMTDYNQEQMFEAKVAINIFTVEALRNFSKFDTTKFPESIKRQISEIRESKGTGQLREKKMKRLSELMPSMLKIYNTAKVCLTNDTNTCYSLDPDLTKVFATSRDYDTLLKAWMGWRDQTGKKMKDLYSEFVQLKNEEVTSEASNIEGYTDLGQVWRANYEMPFFETEMERLYQQLLPLYQHLHAYVRRKLKPIYADHSFPSTGHIPAHLLGHMFAHDWTSLAKEMMPFKDKPRVDAKPEMKKQGYDTIQVLKKADEFFTSMGMIPAPQEFWNNSMFEYPDDGRKAECQPSAWDFHKGTDFRIMMCAKDVSQKFYLIHNLMGYLQYFMNYNVQPEIFKQAANPALLAAFAQAMLLSVQTPEHLHSIGLLNELKDDNETDINFLMGMALEHIAFFPYGYLLARWRWNVFNGETKPNDYTRDWWDLRCEFQGLSPPVRRTTEDFDPGAKYHIPANIEYISYFMSTILQFQIHKAACDAAGNTKPLHRCDISNSTDAGDILRNMLELGSSKAWPDALEVLTQHRNMDGKPVLEYFQPLLEYLMKENGDDYGWDETCSRKVYTMALSSLGSTVLLSLSCIAFVTSITIIHNVI